MSVTSQKNFAGHRHITRDAATVANTCARAPHGNRDDALFNPLAPDVRLGLSPEIEAAASQLKRSGSLSPFATPDEAITRRFADPRDTPSILRSAFERDTEKILHLNAYNRLNGKTQVFSFRAHDDLTRRGLHVQLVARVARSIGQALGLNLDLIEAIALGHDLGHTPFGHVGEHMLNKIYHASCGRYFFHNVQSVRVMDQLAGRNISLQVLDGALCHNGEFELQRFETSGLTSFEEFDQIVDACWETGGKTIAHLRPMTLEGCVMRISDIIAYVGKDRQDALAAGIVDAHTFDDGLGGAYNAWALQAFVADIVEHSFGQPTIQMSEAAFSELKRAKRENYQKIYLSGEVAGDYSDHIAQLFSALYEHLMADLVAGRESSVIFKHHINPIQAHLMPYNRSYTWESDLPRTVIDFIASMTDDYFMALCHELFDGSLEVTFPHVGYFNHASLA